MSFASKLRTYSRLGPSNVARVAIYRLGLRLRLHPVQYLAANVPQGPFFRLSERSNPAPIPNKRWDSDLWWFGKHHQPRPDDPPDWFDNPFSDRCITGTDADWWQIPDFSAGDIKGVWELSRFDWVVAWATCAANGDVAALTRLNSWIEDWVRKNPPYKGPNWKCGQETSIRVIHSCIAAKILGQDHKPEPGLIEMVRGHLQRIAPTMSYAIGQQNNHGTSEAAALFIGGSLLKSYDHRSSGWISKGRHWLENRAANLIASDGSFSQHSITYHRMMIDSYSLAEVWRRATNQPPFSSALQDKLAVATLWLESMTIPETGDAPNLGANDGVRLIPLTESDYRDFRPSVQLAAALFDDRDAFGFGPWNSLLDWLEVPLGQKCTPPTSETFDAGGYHLMHAGRAFAMIRYPRYRFRPGQADALHLDLWLDGENLLRDAGSYSYNAEGSSWFRSTAAHNTVQFDNRDQMPRLSRFLFGEWLKAEDVAPVKTIGRSVLAGAAYTDYKGARHHRETELTADYLRCVDTLSGEFQSACLRWRLMPGNWMLNGNELRREGVVITIEGDVEPSALLLTHAPESRYYQHQEEIPVLEIRLDRPGRIETKVTF
ncbi:heparinase II/III family protein [Sulfitobacter geojensis]|uniref:heparinase II/III family protein n=1 Tax=Sulfitobacter geojensis TaxID=1342299 RepID=UPI002490059D|nr:heparinase II/III-family protein [Sulfitobacter geojensis]